MSPSARPPVLLHADPLPDDPPGPSGWRNRRGFDLPGTPWDLSGRRIAAIGSIETEADASAALQALARGVGLVIRIAVDGDLRHRVLEDLHRLGDVREVRPEDATFLDDEDELLLEALRSGATVADTARQLHISLRTANRRLATIRSRFGVDTTAEAVTRWEAQRPDPSS